MMGDLTNKMGLATWDQPLDPYNYLQLSNNWQILDFHDHSPGRGVPISASGIASGAIGLAQLSGVALAYIQNLSYTPASTSVSAASGQWVMAAPSTTVTLPAPTTANQVIAVHANGSVTGSTPVTVSGSNIQGVGLSSATSFLLGTPYSYAGLISDGTNWNFMAGQQDTGWVPITSFITNVVAGSPAAAARLRGNDLALRGGITNSTGASIAATTNLLTLPASTRIQASVAYGTVNLGNAAVISTVTSGGGVSVGSAFPNGNSLYFISTPLPVI